MDFLFLPFLPKASGMVHYFLDGKLDEELTVPFLLRRPDKRSSAGAKKKLPARPRSDAAVITVPFPDATLSDRAKKKFR